MERDTLGAATPRRELPMGSHLEETLVERYPRRFADRPVTRYTPREVGLEGESIATHSLLQRGYDVVDRNWRCGWGEADIVCLQDETAVLVEVKTRLDLADRGDIMPEVAVTRQKRERYGNIALCYLGEHPGLFSVRFDVVAVTVVSEHLARIHHLVSAFSWDD